MICNVASISIFFFKTITLFLYEKKEKRYSSTASRSKERLVYSRHMFFMFQLLVHKFNIYMENECSSQRIPLGLI